MNRLHRWYCSSGHWKQITHDKVLPWGLRNIRLGDHVLEVGPGPGISTEWLHSRVGNLACLEKDAKLADDLARRMRDTNVDVRCGDATSMPYPKASFSAIVSFTMLHHIPSRDLQDCFFAEAYRVLKPGGTLVAVDSLPSLLMSLFHIGDTMVLVPPDTVSIRLSEVGFDDIEIEVNDSRFRFSARRPNRA